MVPDRVNAWTDAVRRQRPEPLRERTALDPEVGRIDVSGSVDRAIGKELAQRREVSTHGGNRGRAHHLQHVTRIEAERALVRAVHEQFGAGRTFAAGRAQFIDACGVEQPFFGNRRPG